MLQDMSDTVHLFAEAWKVMVGRLPSPHIEETDDAVSCFGNVPLIFLNASVIVRPAESLEEFRKLLQSVIDRAKSASTHAAGIVVREDWMPEGWESVVHDLGLVPAIGMTGMETSTLLPPRRPSPELEIRRVKDDESARDLAVLNANAYQMPVELFDCICNMALWHDDSHGYVGYREGKPVSCAAVFPVAGTVYVALVATHPDEQGKGYAETVMRRAVTEGQKAMRAMRTTLHASDMGRPVYAAMGYESGPRLHFLAPAH